MPAQACHSPRTSPASRPFDSAITVCPLNPVDPPVLYNLTRTAPRPVVVGTLFALLTGYTSGDWDQEAYVRKRELLSSTPEGRIVFNEMHVTSGGEGRLSLNLRVYLGLAKASTILPISPSWVDK